MKIPYIINSINDIEYALEMIKNSEKNEIYYDLFDLYHEIISKKRSKELIINENLIHPIYINSNKYDTKAYVYTQIKNYNCCSINKLILQVVAIIINIKKKSLSPFKFKKYIKSHETETERINQFIKSPYNNIFHYSDNGIWIGSSNSKEEIASIFFLTFENDYLVICYLNCSFVNLKKVKIKKLLSMTPNTLINMIQHIISSAKLIEE